MLSLHVSIFTLVAAAIDRFKVIYRPLSYNVKSSISLGWKICVILWIILIILASLPLGIVGNTFQYTIELSVLSVPSYFSNSLFVYYYFWLIFLISIVAMWILTVVTFVFYKKYSKKRQQIISTKAQKQEIKKQIRFLFTLGIMVGVFSLCLLPLLIFLILGFVFRIFSFEIFLIVLTCSMVFASSNSLWNFFIYNARDKAFRTTFKRLFKKLLCRSKKLLRTETNTKIF